MSDAKVIKLPMANRHPAGFQKMDTIPEMEAFIPFNTVFGAYDPYERTHIHALVARYKVLLRNNPGKKSVSRQELEALRWVLKFLKDEIEDVD